ncbi:hypothetical protein Mal64_38720 [Pseudobythopirellula maris]|uniref:Uncharacterized protein n=1 Tax=Pseudobythopirellula maris TaxID=2527991 RepID=A0A5C5ZHH6_9BACT|nr:hypothetical protein [Pseudobythopirellula maris]TWT86331.1 hypothetical protein Mal64_38720 [Pseudobythopirellula maris]
MDQLDLLRLVVETLDRLGVDYAVVGSFASGAWGEPRLTQDIDLVVDLDVFDAESICNAFHADDFYVSKTAAHEAVECRGQFNLLHPASGNKIDFMIAGDSDWSRTQLSRCIQAPLLPEKYVKVAAPEDVILAKLIYYREGGSEKHVRDITGILVTGAVEIDRQYLDRFAEQLGVEEEWRSILQKLGEL